MLMTFQKDSVDSRSDNLRADITKFDTELAEDFKSQMSIAPFLSRKIVSFQGNKSKPAYNWYKYKEAYSAGLVEYFLSNYEGGTQGKVLDPFAGIGTTLFAASEQDIHADGIELLPIGQKIIQSRIMLQKGLSTNDTDKLEWWISSQPWKGYPERIPFSTFRITEGAYPSDTVESIEQYRGAMHRESEKIQAILRLALLCVLESISIPESFEHDTPDEFSRFQHSYAIKIHQMGASSNVRATEFSTQPFRSSLLRPINYYLIQVFAF